MNDIDHNDRWALVKLAVIWAGTVFGSIKLSDLVLTATLVYTMLQIWLSVRKLMRKQDEPPKDD